MNISDFRNILNLRLQKVLKQSDFCETDNETFVRRNISQEINVIWIQKHSSESKVCVNLGVHYDFLPKIGSSELIEKNDITQPECEIRKRLTQDASQNDFWWSLDANQVDDIVRLIGESALSYFDQYALVRVMKLISTPSQFENNFPVLLSSLTKVRACLLMARIYEEKGNFILASEFSRLGIKVAGMAIGSKKALKEILKRTDNKE